MNKFLLYGAGFLAVALYFATNYALDLNERLAQEKFSKILVERNVESLKKERQVWDNARQELGNAAEARKINFNLLMVKYNELEYKSKAFLDMPVPVDLSNILLQSDNAAMREYIQAAERYPEAYKAADYSNITNKDVFRNREEYVQALASCNADKRVIYIGFYGDEKKPGD